MLDRKSIECPHLYSSGYEDHFGIFDVGKTACIYLAILDETPCVDHAPRASYWKRDANVCHLSLTQVSRLSRTLHILNIIPLKFRSFSSHSTQDHKSQSNCALNVSRQGRFLLFFFLCFPFPTASPHCQPTPLSFLPNLLCC